MAKQLNIFCVQTGQGLSEACSGNSSLRTLNRAL